VPDWTIEAIAVGPLQVNAYLLTARVAAAGRGEALLIDPGAEPDRLKALVDASGCRLVGLLATHGHFDHVGSAAEIQRHGDLALRCHPDDLPLIQNMPAIQRAYGFPGAEVPICDPTLADGSRIAFGRGFLEVVHVPGHSPGGVMFVWPGHAVVGDCLFAGSVGRTDLPGGDFATLDVKGRDYIGVYSANVRDDRDGGMKKSPGERSFCKRCGSALWVWDPRWPELVHPFASAIDTELPLPPERTHLMLASKPSWVEVNKGPQDKLFDGYPDESIAEWHARHGV